MSWEWGCPDLPACGPWRGSINGPVWPSFGSNYSRPSRGAKPREADDTKTSNGIGPPRAGSQGAEISMQGRPHEVRLTGAMTTKARWVLAGVEYQLPLWCRGGKQQAHSLEESTKGFHSGATRPRPLGCQDGGHHRAHHNITASGFCRRRPL